MLKKLEKQKTAGQIVQAARAADKITAHELLNGLFPDLFELHGDRGGEDDPAVIGGIAHFNDRAVTVVAIDKGTTAEERIAKHFGCPTPAGYRKALRLMKQAEKFNRPVITLINTAGAFAGRSAEEKGQGHAIATNLLEIAALKVPVIAVIYGEGGSGGALALACGDQVWMLDNSMYSVLSPEGFASILWKDANRSDEAAEVMQLTPTALAKNNIIEGVIHESRSHRRTVKNIAKVLDEQLNKLCALSPTELVAQRHERFRKF